MLVRMRHPFVPPRESVRVGTGSVLSGIVVGDVEVIEAGTHMEALDSEGMVALGAPTFCRGSEGAAL